MVLLATSTVLQLARPQFPTGVKHKKHLRAPSNRTEQLRTESGEQLLQEKLKQLLNNCLCVGHNTGFTTSNPMQSSTKSLSTLKGQSLAFKPPSSDCHIAQDEPADPFKADRFT